MMLEPQGVGVRFGIASYAAWSLMNLTDFPRPHCRLWGNAAGWANGPRDVQPVDRLRLSFAMPGLVPGIHLLRRRRKENVDGRDKPGHDVERTTIRADSESLRSAVRCAPLLLHRQRCAPRPSRDRSHPVSQLRRQLP
jgi:hypothetical protein